MEYHLVQFTNDNTLAVVPDCWMKGTQLCYWPPYGRDSIKINNASITKETPNANTWKIFPAIITESFENYYQARNNLVSDSDTQTKSNVQNQSKQRKCTRNISMRKRRISDPDKSSDSDKEEIALMGKQTRMAKRISTEIGIRLPPEYRPDAVPLHIADFPISSLTGNENELEKAMSISTVEQQISNTGSSPVMHQNYHQMLGSNDVNSNLTSSYERQSQANIYKVRDYHSSECFKDSLPLRLPHDVSQKRGWGQPDQSLPTFSSASCKENCAQSTNFQKEILRQLHIINMKVDNNSENIRLILQRVSQSSDSTTQGNYIFKVLNTKEELDELEIELQAPQKKSDLIRSLSSVGGKDVNETTYRTMKLIMTDSLAKDFSYAGQTAGKYTFNSLALKSCICAAVKRNSKLTGVTDKDIEEAIKYWLKNAPRRFKPRI